jgi:molybdenum cofactor biosynthesis enzyme MoaA
MPWKALFMDESGGQLVALPCCRNWITADYGHVAEASLQELWNSSGAQDIRRQIAEGRQGEVCKPTCPHHQSGDYSEAALRILDGPQPFVDNQRLNHHEIRARQTVLQSRPMLLKILPTLECNLRCTMCFQDYFGPVELGPEFWNDVHRLLPFLREITIQGGEATLHAESRSFLASPHLRNHPQLRVSLITNGTVLDQNLVDLLSAIRMSCVIISLNAATRETYRRIAGADLFLRVLGNIRRCVKLAATHPLGSFEVLLSFVVMQSNFRELPDFVRLAERLGVGLQLHPVCGDRGKEGILGRAEERNLLQEILREASQVATRQATRVQLDQLRPALAGTGHAGRN